MRQRQINHEFERLLDYDLNLRSNPEMIQLHDGCLKAGTEMNLSDYAELEGIGEFVQRRGVSTIRTRSREIRRERWMSSLSGNIGRDMDRFEFIDKMVSEKGFTLSDAELFAKEADANISMFTKDGKRLTYYDYYLFLPPAIPAPIND